MRITKSLLRYGVPAGLYTRSFPSSIARRPWLDFARDSCSPLSTGPLGWVQVAGFVVTGAMTMAFAVGAGCAVGVSGGSQ